MFTVVPFNSEFQNITPNFQLLQEIARKTGGKFYTPNRFLKQFPEIPFTRREKYRTGEIHLGNWNYGLYLLLFLLTVEWIFRKRWGLL